MASIVAEISNSADRVVNSICNPISSFLGKYSGIYKVVLVASHLFRTAGMYGFMMISPYGLGATCGLMLAASFLYRAAVEKKCAYHFALPSCVGAWTYWYSRTQVIRLVSGGAFSSLNLALNTAAGALPFIGYLAYAVYISHREFKACK